MPLARYAAYGGGAVIVATRCARLSAHRTAVTARAIAAYPASVGWASPTVQKEVQSHSPWMFTGSGDPDVFVTAKAPATSATRPPTAVTAVVS
jgi:hypothetical protein